MKTLQVGTVLCVALLLTGCASSPTMDRAEFLSATSRTYDGVTEEQFFVAAKKLFMLADPSDVTVSYPGPHVMVINCTFSLWGWGNQKWRLSTSPVSDGITALVYVDENDSNYGKGFFGARYGYDAPAVYGLFWARMSYLLNRSTTWSTCDEWDKLIDSGQTYGDLDPLCGLTLTDNAPSRSPATGR